MAIKTLGDYVKENKIDMNRKYTTQELQDITWTKKQKQNLTRYQPKKKEKKGNFITRTIATVDDAFLNMSKGFLDTTEGIADTFSYLIADVEDFFGADEWAERTREQTKRNLIDELYGNSKTVKAIKNEAYQNKYVTSIEEGFGNVAAMAGGAKALSWANMGGTTSTVTTSFTSAYGNATSEALRNGADMNTARKAGLINGTAEALSEQFFDALPGMKVEGWGSKVIGKIGSGVERYFGTNTGKLVMKALNASGEGFEEIISNMLTSAGNDIMHHFDKNYTYGMENQSGNILKDVWRAATSKESWDSFISAALTSAITNGGNTLVSNTQKNNIIKSYAKENNMSVKQVKDMFNQTVKETTEYQKQQQPKMNLGEQVELEQQNKIRTLEELQKGTFVQPGTETDAYQYQEADNEKVNNVRKSLAELNVNNTIQTREMAKTAERLARDLGIDIEFTNNEKLQSQMSEEQKKETQGRIVNGFVDKNTGKMYLNVDSDQMANFTIGHETKHFFEANEELNDVLNKALKEYAQLKGRYDEDLARVTKTYTDKNGNLIADPETELMADYVGEFFTDYDFVSNLSTKNPSLFQKTKDFFQKLYYKATGQQEKLLLKQINDNINKAYREYAKNKPDTNISSNEIQKVSQKEEIKQEIKKKVKPKEETVLPIAEKTEEKQEVVKKQEKKVETKEKPQVKQENRLTKEEQEELDGLQAAEETFGNEGEYKVRYDYLMDKKNGNLKYPSLKTETTYQDIKNKYTKYKNNMEGFNSDLIQQAKDFVPGYRNTERRTKQQWLDVAEMIGKRANFKTDAELEKYAIQSWFKEQPNQKSNLNRQGEKFVKFTIEDWINSVYKGAGVGERIDNSIQYSLSKDSQGRELSEQQQEFFKESKVRDENGNLQVMYHGSYEKGFTIFDKKLLGSSTNAKSAKQGFFFTDKKSLAQEYAKRSASGELFEVYLNITNPLIKDFNGENVNADKELTNLLKQAKLNGNDGLIALNLKDGFRTDNQYIVFDSNQIKNVDNTNPTDSPDIRYSLSKNEDSYLDELSKEQMEYFKDTKAVDNLGYLDVVFHGTPEDFTVFDISKTNDVAFGNGLYFTTSEGNAESYSKSSENPEGKVLDGYVNIKKPASRTEKTITFDDFKNLYNELNNNPDLYDDEMGMSNINALLSDYGNIYDEKIDNILRKFYDSYDNDVTLIDNLSYMDNAKEMYKTLRDVTGVDGIIVDNPTGFDDKERYYIIFNPDQFKLKSNKTPTTNEDIRYSISQEGEDLESYYQDLYPIKNKVTTRLNDLKRKEVELPIEEEKPLKLSKNEQKQANEIKEEYLPLAKNNEVLRVDAENIAKEINKTGDFDTTKQRKWIQSLKNSDAIQDKGFLKDLNMDKLSYEVQTNQKSLDRANDYIENNGYENSLNHVKDLIRSEKTPTATDVALLQRMTQEAIKNKDYQTAQELIMDTAILGTDLGQAVQAMSIIQKLTPEGQLKLYTKMINRAKIRGEKAFTDVEITPDMVETLLGAYNEDGTYDQNDLTARVEKFKQDVATQMKSTVGDKLNSWRYLSMLGNPKTHIRNVVSNVAMKGTIKVKNTLARTFETILPVKERTKTFEKASKEIKNYAKETAAEMKGIITGENKYNEKVALEQEKQIFKNKALEGISRFNSAALEAEDWFFSRSAFESNLSEYLTANGIKSMEDIKNNPEIVEKAKIYAVEQAEIATFRQYSKLAAGISRIERNGKLSKYAINAVLPFKKTPINVAKAGFNYSPLGLIKNISYDAYQLKQGNINGSQFIDNISQGLTGTSVALLGYALAKAGILSGGGDDDKEGKYDSQLGKQSYALNIGGKTYSISWLSPTGMPLLVGANLYEKLEEDKDWSFDVIADTLANTLDPMSEMSFLSSLTDVLKSYNTGGTQMIKSMGEAGAQSYILQFFPTLFGQLASTLDDTKRSTKASNNSNWKFGEETIRKIMLKVPGLRNQLEEQTDIWGNAKQQTNNIITRAVESFIAPYSKTEDITSDIDKEIKRVFNKTGETSVIPGIPQAYVKKDDETFKMSASEYTKYKQTFGQTANRTMNELFNSSSYKEVDDTEKAKMIENVYKYAREQAKQEYFNSIKEDYNAKETNKVDKIQDTYGITAGDYYANKDEYSYAEKNPDKYLTISQVGNYKDYNEYKSEISRIKKEYDNTNDRKNAVFEYINSLPLNVEQKLILQKTAANYSVKQYRGRLQDYIESLDLSADEKQAIDKVLFD